MTDREALEKAVSCDWGWCEELASPKMYAFIIGYLAGDPDAERFAELHTRGNPQNGPGHT